MFSEKPHMNIISQLLGAVVLFVLFQIYISSLRIEQALNGTNYAITQMQQRHFYEHVKKSKIATPTNSTKLTP